MTLSEIRTLISELQQLDLDNQAGASPSAVNLTSQVNRAIRWLAEQTLLCYDDKVTLTLVADTRKYVLDSSSFSKRMLDIDDVCINGNYLKDISGKRGLWKRQDIADFYPDYLTSSSGTPARAAKIDQYHLILDPAPTQAVVDAGENFVGGPYIPTTLVNSTDDDNSPDIPVSYHEHIAYIAAAFSSTPLVSEAEGWKRLEAYNNFIATDLRKIAMSARNHRQNSSYTRGSSPDWGVRLATGWDGRQW